MRIGDIASPMRDRSMGRRLKAAMAEKGVTVRRLSEETGLSSRTITKLRSGESEGTFASWRAIARALRMSVEELVG